MCCSAVATRACAVENNFEWRQCGTLPRASLVEVDVVDQDRQHQAQSRAAPLQRDLPL